MSYDTQNVFCQHGLAEASWIPFFISNDSCDIIVYDGSRDFFNEIQFDSFIS
jgi:hypothetical protein